MVQVITSVLVWVITGLIGLVCTVLFKLLKEERANAKAMRNGMRTLLRNELIKTHREYVESSGKCPLAVKEYTERTYKAYHELDGNGTGTTMYEDIMALPVEG